MRTTRTRPRARRDGGGERPRDDHKETLSRPTGYDRDQAVAPRIEVTLVEASRDASTRLAEGGLATVPGANACRRRAVRPDFVLMVPQCAPYLALDRPVVELALADQAVGRGRDGILLRRHVQAFDDEEPVASEETTHLRDGCRAGVVLEDAGERIVRRDDEIEFAVAGKRFEPRADVEHAACLEPLDESLPLGRVVAETHLHKVAACREHIRSRAPAVPAKRWPCRRGTGGSAFREAPAGSPRGRSRTR